MWKFKPFMTKEQTGLEGRCIDVGSIKLHVKNIIAEGGFSSVYLARDAVNVSKQYALKHIICNDEESLDLAMKEISVMKSLKGHPNVVTLYSHGIFDTGRTKEVILVMEFCEKSLVNVLENRGAGYFEEKQVLTIFRDVCNAVFAMHCQSPPIAHRDLKAENLLLGSDGLWKLCDFGSTSINHKRFEKPEEMGIEEDNIRKYTTPAYRAPEMWDLFRRDLINEKVDIWALGCLLFRICYFKSAFDGDSKLQILNGNYRIPDLPKYSSSVTDLIQDMLQPSPEARPDITQVWFRVNELLPSGLQKSLPDRPPELRQSAADIPEGISKAASKVSIPRRSPPAPPSLAEPNRSLSPSPPHASGSGTGGAALGAFWSTQHAKDSLVEEGKIASKSDKETTKHNTSKNNPNNPNHLEKHWLPGKTTTPGKENIQARPTQRTAPGESSTRSTGGLSKDIELRFSQENPDSIHERSKEMKSETTATFQNEAFNAFVADFDTSKLQSSVSGDKSGSSDSLGIEVEKLKEQLRQASLEKAEITSKYEKLAAICRSQRQEIQELKQVLAARSPSPNKDALKYQSSPGNQSSTSSQRERSPQDLNKDSTVLDPKPWQAFADDPSPAAALTHSTPHSVRTRNGPQKKQNIPGTSSSDVWGFGADNFSALPAGSAVISRSTAEGNSSKHFGDSNSMESKPPSQPAGWAGF
ncbi:hypothetical protein Ancab_006702 [Ancistrocladus abbreviatus]